MASRLNASDKNSDFVRKRIEKHKFDDEEGEEYAGSKFGGFGDYFRRKKIKLQNLDAELRSSAVDNPHIFRGVVAHVNGYTQPSLNDLHHLVVSHGGGFMQYLDGKTTVTHIIASNLTPKKCIEFRRYRIVKPAWIVDSIEAGKLLPWNAYRVVDEGKAQNILSIDNGRVESQANQLPQGYKDQTATSWYTAQLSKEETAGLVDSDVSCKVIANEPRQAGYHQILSERQLSKQLQEEGGLYEDHEFCTGAFASLAASGNQDNESPPRDTTISQSKELSTDYVDKPNASPEKELTAEEHNVALLSDPRMRKSSVLNPAFLQQYYAESRLHHLSAWKAEIKANIQRLAAERSLTQKARQQCPAGSRRYVLHVDFDSFFAAVSLLKRPELATQPVVVAHGSGPGSEIASCNYPARSFGIKNGMWMKKALELCSDIKVLPYDFESYEKASHGFYSAILETNGIVQSVSVDEALVDISVDCWMAGRDKEEDAISREEDKADEIARSLRKNTKDITGCEVSIGIGRNILLAKLALRKAKPAGQFHLKPSETQEFLGPLPVQSLPGIAYNLGGKLEELGVKIVSDLRNLSENRLTAALGPKTGQKLWEYARGIDHVKVGDQVIRKSVSAEVNWGVRFETQAQAEEFVQSLCIELSRRLLKEGVKGKHLTMKILRRAADAPRDPPKHLGHGKVDKFNKSVPLGVASNSPDIIFKEALMVLRAFNFSPGELRGLGVQMTKLEPIKNMSDPLADGSQKRLQFKTTPIKRSNANAQDSISDEIESPTASRVIEQEAAVPVTASAAKESQETTMLNTLGTQFILPTQVDPQVLSELPKDILSRLRQPPKAGPKTLSSKHLSRSESPTPAPNAPAHQSQLDPEALAALPHDIREEVLSFYSSDPLPSPVRRPTRLSPGTPRTRARTLSQPAPAPKIPSKRPGRPSKASKSNNIKGPIQSSFTTGRPTTRPDSPPSQAISTDFLAALPPDIRTEVLSAQRVNSLSRSSLVLPTTPRALRSRSAASKASAPAQPIFPRPVRREPRPTFTVRKLSQLPDLRDAVKAWVLEFLEEGPYEEDVEALCVYLGKVVVDEMDMTKAVAVAKWLAWHVETKLQVWERDDYVEGANRLGNWDQAIALIRDRIQGSLGKRSIPPVDFNE
ncbi:MAG: deoxycytidyl transferase [Vezdaea aestivalis]|nr:MAG: deoxycytidyl transferase [Vezdaea aestivalis]